MSNFLHLWSIFLGTVVGLLPLINPLAAAPTFLAITEGDTEERRRRRAAFIEKFSDRPYYFVRAANPQLLMDEVDRIL